ncbi:hypothetical protein J6590_013327 [Homalodisca vitripennis]|nr:hypothetical protein J6590_013327 [Homalodisca vitripennis]
MCDHVCLRVYDADGFIIILSYKYEYKQVPNVSETEEEHFSDGENSVVDVTAIGPDYDPSDCRPIRPTSPTSGLSSLNLQTNSNVKRLMLFSIDTDNSDGNSVGPGLMTRRTRRATPSTVGRPPNSRSDNGNVNNAKQSDTIQWNEVNDMRNITLGNYT